MELQRDVEREREREREGEIERERENCLFAQPKEEVDQLSPVLQKKNSNFQTRIFY